MSSDLEKVVSNVESIKLYSYIESPLSSTEVFTAEVYFMDESFAEYSATSLEGVIRVVHEQLKLRGDL